MCNSGKGLYLEILYLKGRHNTFIEYFPTFLGHLWADGALVMMSGNNLYVVAPNSNNNLAILERLLGIQFWSLYVLIGNFFCICL